MNSYTLNWNGGPALPPPPPAPAGSGWEIFTHFCLQGVADCAKGFGNDFYPSATSTSAETWPSGDHFDTATSVRIPYNTQVGRYDVETGLYIGNETLHPLLPFPDATSNSDGSSHKVGTITVVPMAPYPLARGACDKSDNPVIDVFWSSSLGADSYQIEIDGASAITLNPIPGSRDITYTHKSLSAGSSHEYKVYAVSADFGSSTAGVVRQIAPNDCGGGGTKYPDLQAKDISTSGSIKADVNFTVSALIFNNGNGAVINDSFSNSFKKVSAYDGGGTKEITESVMQNNSSGTGQIGIAGQIYKLSVGHYSFQICADSKTEVNEGSTGGEDNNCSGWLNVNVTNDAQSQHGLCGDEKYVCSKGNPINKGPGGGNYNWTCTGLESDGVTFSGDHDLYSPRCHYPVSSTWGQG